MTSDQFTHAQTENQIKTPNMEIFIQNQAQLAKEARGKNRHIPPQDLQTHIEVG